MMKQPQTKDALKMYVEWWDNLKKPQRCTAPKMNDDETTNSKMSEWWDNLKQPLKMRQPQAAPKM